MVEMNNVGDTTLEVRVERGIRQCYKYVPKGHIRTDCPPLHLKERGDNKARKWLVIHCAGRLKNR